MYIDSPDTFYTTDDTIGGRISLGRDANGLSVEAAALAIGIAAGTWIDWENDRDAPFPDRLVMIAEALGVSLAWLVSGRGEGPTWITSDNVSAFRPD
ncbi:helix-turn-helix domain-containing protein [Rhizobium leguminosarum]|uniref:helix-turn-helix domain-containing protein n=1 Tax=Rhizobium leguminosarum TaxID=384 RepID=UPI00041A1EE9|nr:helix-turn-helix domain-containing protein [Rhizobium leguminosarum]NKL67162.1 helix-turn-helix domain-containing protein [Rhizobium leguminosarum bv. viciae]